VEQAKHRKQSLVSATADRLRDRVFAEEPGALIGSLQDLARSLHVGIVTVQQAARVLEHEGLLAGRRGPGGGYYGMRPNAAALERSITAYLRSNPTSYEEALNITSLLFNELVPAAARSRDHALRDELSALQRRVDACETGNDCGQFENDFQDLLFRMVDWPLFKLLSLVTLQIGLTHAERILGFRSDAIAEWKEGRRRIIAAMLAGDTELARFEANRSNRRVVMARF
jgi:GntR family transcriptional regulator, transcriptional repressor for pyruvate dehydrogenase complex